MTPLPSDASASGNTKTPLPLRVLVVPHLTELSGAPMMAVRIARRLDPARFRCRVVFPGPGELADRAREEGLEVDTLGLLPLSYRQAAEQGRRREWIRSRWGYVKGFNSLLRQFRPGVVYVHSAIQPIPGLLARRQRLPLVWHVQETLDYTRRTNRFRRALIRRMADTVIFCGWAARDSFGPRPERQRWEVVPNALTRESPENRHDLREQGRREFGVSDTTPVLVMVGGVHPRKGLDVLLRALGHLQRHGRHDFLLLVAGTSESAPPAFLREIDGLLDRENLRPRVRLLGHRDDVVRLLAAGDVFVLASRSEGLPLSVVEAFALGLPAVLTDAGDCAALTGDGERGFTVPRENAEGFAAALDRILLDSQARREMGRRARHYAMNRFQFSALLDEVSRILEETSRR